MEFMKIENRQRGSATIEAVVGFTAFLFAIFTILGFVNFCRAQMIVSAAVDTATKELSQYAYFYEMSGLQKFEQALDGNADVGKKNINEVISTVDQLYSNINGAVEQSKEDQTNIANMLAAGESEFQAMENRLNGIENDAEAMINAFTQVGNDPLLYMRSLVSIIGSEGMEVAKRAIAVPLAKSFVSRHFGDSDEEASEFLSSLGIIDGLEGMNFSLSNIFSDAKFRDIEIVVYYRVKLFQVFDWVMLEAPVSKVAVCRAWLGGDNVQKKVSPTANADLGDQKASEETQSNQSVIADSPFVDGDIVLDAELTYGNADGQTPGNSSTGNWALQHDPRNYEGSDRNDAFRDEMVEEYGLDSKRSTYHYTTSDEAEMAYTCDVFAEWNYGPGEGEAALDKKLRTAIMIISEGYADLDGHVQEFMGVTEILYIPENMPEDQYNALVAAVASCEAEMGEYAESLGLPADFFVDIKIERAGGTYDYGGSEGDDSNVGCGG